MKRQRFAKFIAPRVYLGRKCKSLVGSQEKGRGGSAEGDGSIFTKEQELEVNQGMLRALIYSQLDEHGESDESEAGDSLAVVLYTSVMSSLLNT
jgi:hypothetical protein